jgi:methylated-DNA-[protein]-cysteine S-methyltransferase
MSKASYNAVLAAPFGALGVVIAGHALVRIDFLPADTPLVSPCSAIARQVCEQLLAYLANPGHYFSLPVEAKGTHFQRKVWQALTAIPVGEVLTYGELARRIGSSPRAVGQACGANPVPLVVPCHRVLAKAGTGGFMHSRSGDPLRIKQWLLEHESSAR